MGAWRHRRRVFVRLRGVRRHQSADRPPDGSRRPARRDGTRRRADGGGLVAGAAEHTALASLSDDRRHGRVGQRLSRLFRAIVVSAELVHSPARPGDGAGLRRRRNRLDDAIALGAAHDRADRLAHRLHRDGHPGSGRACADQPAVAKAPGGHRARAGRRRGAFGVIRKTAIEYRRSGLGRHRLERRALRTARFWWISLGYFGGLYIWYAVQVHQTKYLLDIGFSPSVAVWALGAVSLLGIPGQIWLRPLSDRVGREWIWTAGCAGFAICFAALIALKSFPVLPLVYLMVVTQGALGYGLTSIMGAVVLEIFQGKHYGSIFGTVMLAALAGGAAGPWATGFVHDLTGSYAIAFAIGIGISALSAFAIWMASPRKIRAVAGQLHRIQDGITAG